MRRLPTVRHSRGRPSTRSPYALIQRGPVYLLAPRGGGHALAYQGEIAADLWRPGQRWSELVGAAGSGSAHAAPGGPVTAMGREGRIRVMLVPPAR